MAPTCECGAPADSATSLREMAAFGTLPMCRRCRQRAEDEAIDRFEREMAAQEATFWATHEDDGQREVR